MRVLMAIAEMGSGGAEAVAEELCLQLAGEGHHVTLASSGGFRAERLRVAEGVAVVLVPLHVQQPLAFLRSVRGIARHARRHPVDVVHAHNIRATAAAWLGIRVTTRPGRRPPVVTTVHGLRAQDYRRAAQVLRWTADLVVAVADSVRDDLVAAGLDPARVRVVENAVPPAVVHDGAAVRSELGIPSGVLVALSVARLVAPHKRHDLLLDAWARRRGHAAARDDALLLLAGDGPNRLALEAQADELGLDGSVLFLGTRTDVPRLLAAADVMVLASDWEGLPMAVLEAMAAGTAVVATDVGGLPSLGDAVETVPRGSVTALADALDRVLDDRACRDRLVARGAAEIERRFSAASMARSYVAHYHEAGVEQGRRDQR